MYCTSGASVLHSEETLPPARPGFQLSGALETDAVWNANHPADGRNQDFGFISHADKLSFTEGTLSLEANLGRAGFHLDGGAGDFYKAAMVSDSWRGPNQYISQAYAFWTPYSSVRIEAGKFFSSVGAEVPQSYQNFNTTRSLLSWYASPLYHVGIRASTPAGKGYTIGAQMLSGCNTVIDGHGRQTLALTGAWSGEHWGWSQIYMDGNEKFEGRGRRHLSDTVFTFSPSPTVAGYTEVIAAAEKRNGPGYDQWYGWATAWKVSPRQKWSLSPRFSFLDDIGGATTGASQRLLEFTITGEYRFQKSLIARVEYRNDWSNRAFYLRAANLLPSHHQQTLAAGLTLLFKAWRL
jgi:hypothetical protein